jgi:hypothetical protein
MLAEEMRRTAAAKTPDKKTGRLAKLFCEQCFQIEDVQIVDDRHVVSPNFDLTFTDERAVIAVVNQMCETYGLDMAIERQQRNWIVTIRRRSDPAAARSATSTILRRAVLQAAIDAHSTYVAPAFRGAQAGDRTTTTSKRMLIPQIDIPGSTVMVEYPADLTDDEFELLRSKIHTCLTT